MPRLPRPFRRPGEGYFQTNGTLEQEKRVLYTDMPYHFTWDLKTAEWKPRKQGKDRVVSRLAVVNPKDTERFFLRALLLHVRDATSFEDLLLPRDGELRVVEGEAPHATYRDAAKPDRAQRTSRRDRIAA